MKAPQLWCHSIWIWHLVLGLLAVLASLGRQTLLPELHALARCSPCTAESSGIAAKEHSSQDITYVFISVAFLLLLLPVQFPICLLPGCCRHNVIQPAQVMQGEDALKCLPDPHQGQQLGSGQSISQHCAMHGAWARGLAA